MTALAIGARVTAPHPDPYLRNYHRVVARVTEGTVVRPSQLGPDDSGWLVDWGYGGEVRCEARELAIVPTDPRPAHQIVVSVKGNVPTVVPNAEHLPWHYFDNTLGDNATGTQLTPRLGSQDMVMLALRAQDAGFELDDVLVRCSDTTLAADANKYADIVPALLHLRQGEAVQALIRYAHVSVDDITVRRDGVTWTFGRAGGYIGSDDTAFREVFVPHWRGSFPEKSPQPRRPWRRLHEARA